MSNQSRQPSARLITDHAGTGGDRVTIIKAFVRPWRPELSDD